VISAGLARIGLYLYPIYLWHIAARDWGMWIIRSAYKKPIDFRIEFLIYDVFSIIVGIFAVKIIEKPVLRLRDRFYHARNRPEASLPNENLERSQKAWSIDDCS
jgi:peptidoglycan/LPS O-acetylase OafA/YrhL